MACPNICPLCRKAHWPRDPHIWDEPKSSAVPEPIRQGKPTRDVSVSRAADGVFDRNKYQREYMRKWRALRKQNVPSRLHDADEVGEVIDGR